MNEVVDRLAELVGDSVRGWVEAELAGNPAPERALTNLERWLTATSSPSLYLQQLMGMPHLGALLLVVLGASQPVADALIQNPELASLVFEPGELRRVPTREAIVREGERLLARSTSYTHSLDRLRFLKQRWNLALVLNDLSGSWPQETVWRVLSDLADALIELTQQLVWDEQRKLRDLPETCPVMVVGFGKLGGHELNYSSDVDLAYAIPDGTDEKLERDIVRYCEALGRALSDRMGRGSLFRVDLRLRPYGGAGPIVRSMRSVEAYYRLYAEPWEIQALLRSRPICGPQDLCERWDIMRHEHCFRPKVSEIMVEQMLAMRARIEEGAVEQDLKRAAGGIRDVEFLVQVLQLIHGHSKPAIQAIQTCDALREMDREGLLDPSVATGLEAGYVFLRKLEHRIQLVGDRQTHTIPEGPSAREALARSMSLGTWVELERELHRHRRTIGTLYRATFHPDQDESSERSRVLRSFGSLSAPAAQWFDVLPESDAFYVGLQENEGSLYRVQAILDLAPRLVAEFRESVPLTELLMSGEIEETTTLHQRLDRMDGSVPIRQVAEAYRSGVAVACARWVLGAPTDLGADLSHLLDALLRQVMRAIEADFDLIALGSFGAREMGSGSDADLLVLTPTKEGQPKAEVKAQQLLSHLTSMRRYGAHLEFDLRLRPEGKKGLLARTYEGLKAYDLDGMEMWERFALGQARLVAGRVEALEVVQKAAYAVPLTPERLKELVRMKKRIENERVQVQHLKRHVKLGHGGLNDIEWMVHLNEMRYPTATHAGQTTLMVDRVRRIGEARLINSIEVEALLEAHVWLKRLRTYLDLQGITDDLLPENPDKLDRLARAMGRTDGHDLLRHHGTVTHAIRRMYEETLERLRA